MNIKGIKLKGVSINTWDGLLDEKTITSGDLHIATKDGEAMFFHDSIDFSSYAGTDGGSTPYRLVFTDSAGKVAVAYGGAAGGGEALGAELFTEWIQRPGYEPDISCVIDGDALAFESSYRYDARIYAVIDAIKDRIYKISLGSCVLHSGGFYKESFGLSSGQVLADYPVLFVEGEYYKTPILDCSYFFIRAVASINMSLGGLGVNPLTDVPVTGLHLMSAKNGTTRNMTSVETGFNPNAVTGVKIYG